MEPTKIEFLDGDATELQKWLDSGQKIILCHMCNDSGLWGAGFTKYLSKKWEVTETCYRVWYANRSHNDFRLGSIQLVVVQDNLWIANMIGQMGIQGTYTYRAPIRHWALKMCLITLAKEALELKATVHMPRIGSGLAGGSWPDIQEQIEQELCAKGIQVVVHTLNL